MLYLKGCGKCNGDLYRTDDKYGTYVACLQCGTYLTDAQEQALLKLNQSEDENVDKSIDDLVRRHIGVLVFLKQNKNPLSSVSISEKLGTDEQSIERFLKNMLGIGDNAGYVNMLDDGNNRTYRINKYGLRVVESYIRDESDDGLDSNGHKPEDILSRRKIIIEFVGYIDNKERVYKSSQHTLLKKKKRRKKE